MWLTNLILFNTLVIGICGLSLFYGNKSRNRLVDKFYRVIRLQLPHILMRTSNTVVGESRTAKIILLLNSILEYIFVERNPLIMYLYIILSGGGYLLFVLFGYPELPNPVLSFPYHQHFGFGLFFITLFFFTKACSDNPGIITKENVKAHVKNFKADGEIFPYSQNACRTCKFQKPPRSKHCSLCNVCVARFDHHCVWINQCVGLGNVSSFLLFLLFNNLLCLYGSYLGCGIIQNLIDDLDLRTAVFRDRITGKTFTASWYYIFVYFVGHHKQLVFLTLFCTFIGVFLLWFTWYHWVTLMRAGITTNEDTKLDRLSRSNKRENAYNQGSWWKNCVAVFSLMTARQKSH